MKNITTDKALSLQLKMLTTVVVSIMLGNATHASVERHGDLEIYKGAEDSKPVVTLMLDLSGSMGTIDLGNNSTCRNNIQTQSSTTTYPFERKYCKSGGKTYYRRIDNLKMGVVDLVNDTSLIGKVKIGVGTYPNITKNSGAAETSGHGKIDVPAKLLNVAHRNDIINFIKDTYPKWNTPTAQSYGEVGSYMMGTNTSGTTQQYAYIYKEIYKDLDHTKSGLQFYWKDEQCAEWGSNLESIRGATFKNLLRCNDWTANWFGQRPYGIVYSAGKAVYPLNNDHVDTNNDMKEALVIENLEKDGLIPVHIYGSKDDVTYGVSLPENDPTVLELIRNGKISEYPIPYTGARNPYSGYYDSAEITKVPDRSTYESPISPNSCAGNAIYFLTDGFPNNSSGNIAKSVMDSALKPKTGMQLLTTSCANGGTQGWDCMFNFTTNLLDKKNPRGVEIKTATVGFGAEFKAVDGATIAEQCNVSTNIDVRNTCKWGLLGKGGFYYADDSQGIVNSVKSLTGKLTTEIPPVSTGSMAVPLDDLNVSTSRKFAYLPLLDPQPLAPNRLWKGNLKKYNIKNGTLVDKDSKAVFANKDGVFATNTADIYNTLASTSRPDKALPQVGGTFPHIFGNGNSRKLYVNQGGSLKNIGTNTALDKPVGFKDLSTYSNLQKQQLLYFLGFPVAPETKDTNGRIINNGLIVDDDKAIGVAFDPTKKQLGGVLHSLPQLISKNAELQADGTIDNTKREDYVLYGSFDGALHVIRDTDSGTNKAGEEVFTFIPKHVLDQQGESFVNPDRIANNPVFGVDGPWSVFTNYKYSSTKVEAQQSLAFGGLRMGGSMYYGLNLSDLNNPKMIYSVGSTYAIDGSSSAKGVKNDVKADSQKAYAKMGLSFAKPSVGYVMKGGERVMVNFLAGGYDRCYEDPNFKLGAAVTTNIGAGCNGKTSAQGNGVYVVQVGQEKIDTTVTDTAAASNESSFDTTSGNGDLLWWASDPSNGAATNNFTPVQDMTHSVVTEIRALDRNYDGLTDQLVFADLGGRVWRVDINSSGDIKDFKIDRVVKTLDLSAAGTNTALGTTDAPPRIYEKPLVTFTRLGEGTDIVGLVTVGTGDRSSPVTAERKVADRIYTFVDRDIARADLFCYNLKSTTINECENVTTTLKQTAAITPASLVELTTNATTGEFTNTATIKTQMDAYTKLGWFLPLTLWSETVTKKKADGTNETVPVVSTDNKGIKMFNQPDAIAGLLFTTVYNPKVGDTSGACSAGVTGLTQREQMCLPYGVCMSKGADGDWLVRKTRYLSNAGIGIVDNIISDGNFSGDTKNSVVVLENFCEGADCSSGKTNLVVNPITEELNCQGMSCKVVTDSQLDPMQWKER